MSINSEKLNKIQSDKQHVMYEYSHNFVIFIKYILIRLYKCDEQPSVYSMKL